MGPGSRQAKHRETTKKRATVAAMDRIDIRQRFDRAADSFDSADFVHAATRDGLFERLAPMTLDAKTIVDLGSATGASAFRLGKTYRRALVSPVDLSLAMVGRASRRSSWFSRLPAVQADAAQLPFADHCIDLVFSNLLLPWVSDHERVFAEIARVLAPGGLFLFSTLGPDSLAGLRHEPFADMHDVGDELVRQGLLDPVLDVDRLRITYDEPAALRRDLVAIGAGDCLPEDPESLVIDLELVYGHCWGSGRSISPGEVRIDPSRIGRRRV